MVTESSEEGPEATGDGVCVGAWGVGVLMAGWTVAWLPGILGGRPQNLHWDGYPWGTLNQME